MVSIMFSNTKQQFKLTFIFTIIPMLLFDILFFIVYHMCNVWSTAAYSSLTVEQSETLPMLLLPPDMPHRMFIPTILVLLVSTLICFFLFTLKSYKSNARSSCIMQIKVILTSKLIITLCMFYFVWYAIMEKLYTTNIGDSLMLLENLFKIYSPIIMIISYALIAFAVFKSKND